MILKSGLPAHEKLGVLDAVKSAIPGEVLRHKDWRIIKSTLTNGLLLEKAFYPGTIFSDSVHFVEKYLEKLYNREFSSILCGGLGLGIAPFMSQSFCTTVDVVETDPDLVQLITSVGYLDPKVNIIQGDFFTYQPDKTYDVILADIWQNEQGAFYTEAETIFQKYSPHLKEGGLLYIPIIDMIERNNCVTCNQANS